MSEQVPVLRGDLGYGRKLSKTSNPIFRALAQQGPVDIHHYNDSDQTTTVETVQDVEPILKANVRDYNDGMVGDSGSGFFREVACIPNVVVVDLFRQGINIFNNDDWPRVAAMLDSNEFQKFRTSPGAISKRPLRQYITPAGRR